MFAILFFTSLCSFQTMGDNSLDINTCVSTAVVVYDPTFLLPFREEFREFHFVDKIIKIKQNWASLGVAAVVWDAAVVLAGYLERHPNIVQNKSVIELGSGTGLAGIVASLLGGSVVLTDQRVAQRFLQKNVNLNVNPALNNAVVKVLEWGKNLDNFEKCYDVILGSDVIYIRDTFPELLETIRYLSCASTIVLLSCKIRYDRDTNFLDILKNYFVVDEIHYDIEKDIRIFQAVKKKL